MAPKFQFLFGIILFALVPFLQGCLTAEMWETTVPSAEASGAGIEGLIVSDGTATSAMPHRNLLLRYVAQGAGDVFYLLPIDDRGNPRPPFNYDGDPTVPATVLESIPAARRSEIARSRLVYTSAHYSESARHIREKKYTGQQASWLKLSDTGDGVLLLCFKLNEDGTIDLIAAPDYRTPQVIPRGFKVAIVPMTQPRPEDQVRKERLTPTLLTPLTLAGDAIILPLGILMVIFGIMPIKC